MVDGSRPKRYLVAAGQVADWLASVGVEGRLGRSWPDRPEVSASGDSSLGWGGLGPIVFFADAYRTLGDDRWLQQADSGGR
jgi:hypothetical protein